MEFEINKVEKEGKEYYSLVVVFRYGQKDRKFLVVPFPDMTDKQKFYYYDLLKQTKQRSPNY